MSIKAGQVQFTRHTPRDFLQLLSHIQHFATGDHVDQHAIQRGIRAYSLGYFLPEIRDELVGYVSSLNASALFALLGALRNGTFRLSEIEAVAARNPAVRELDLRPVLEHLFECSGVGNVNEGHFSFKYRNRNASISFGERIVLHPGLWKALNVSGKSADYDALE